MTLLIGLQTIEPYHGSKAKKELADRGYKWEERFWLMGGRGYDESFCFGRFSSLTMAVTYVLTFDDLPDDGVWVYDHLKHRFLGTVAEINEHSGYYENYT